MKEPIISAAVAGIDYDAIDHKLRVIIVVLYLVVVVLFVRRIWRTGRFF